MTTEEDFRRALELEPDSNTLRLIYADWLEEQGDNRALGYRALGINGWYSTKEEEFWGYAFWCHYAKEGRGYLPGDWWTQYSNLQKPDCSMFVSENAAALAFLRLPPERQAELLAVPVLV